MFKSSILFVVLGTLLFFTQSIAGAPIEHDESISDDLVLTPPISIADESLAPLCFTCSISAFQGWRLYIKSTSNRGFGP
jgi:hypothetical protein